MCGDGAAYRIDFAGDDIAREDVGCEWIRIPEIEGEEDGRGLVVAAMDRNNDFSMIPTCLIEPGQYLYNSLSMSVLEDLYHVETMCEGGGRDRSADQRKGQAIEAVNAE